MPFFEDEKNTPIDTLLKIHRDLDKPAEKLLSNLMPGKSRTQSLNILIACAGTFPSYKAFLKVLRERYPKIKMINLFLVDPIKDTLDLFTRTYPLEKQASIIENRTICPMSLGQFIKNTTAKFDLIFMEHPQIGAIDTCFFTHSRSLRSSLPYLSKILKPDTNVIIACQTNEERWQIKRLLSYSFNLSPSNFTRSVMGRSLVPVIPERYSNGVSISDIPSLTAKQQLTKAENIKSSDRSLWIFSIFSLGLYLLTNFKKGETFISGTASLLLFFSQFFLHQPGRKGFTVKVTISVLQFALFINQLLNTDEQAQPHHKLTL